jgi:hypothetical protein
MSISNVALAADNNRRSRKFQFCNVVSLNRAGAFERFGFDLHQRRERFELQGDKRRGSRGLKLDTTRFAPQVIDRAATI